MPSLADPSLRVALAHDWLTGMRGGEKVLEQLCAFFPEAPIYTLFHFPGTVSKTIESHAIRTSFLQNAPGVRKRYRDYLPLFPLAIQNLDLSAFDLVVSTSHCVAKGVSTRAGVHVCYCHTPMRYAWDQRRVYFPSRGPRAWPRDLILAALRSWDRRTSSRVDHFVANSSFVEERIRNYYDRSSTVIAPPVDVDFFTPTPSASAAPGAARAATPAATPGGGRYALMVAALSAYKRPDAAIEACRRSGIELRIVGTGPEENRLRRSSDNNTRLLGRVSAVELRELYRNATCLIQPGVEDFGIAVVEALACGCPVVALDRGGVRDIVENGLHGILYGNDPSADGDGRTRVHQLALAIDKNLQMEFNKLNLRQRAECFSVPGFAQKMRAVLQRAIESPGELS